MAKEDWSEAKAWMRATRERIGMTQHDAAVLANLTVDMVKKYESEKYRIQPSGRMREMLEHYLAEHRRAVAAIMERHRGDERAVLSFSRVSNLPEGLPDWVRAEESVKRRAAAVVYGTGLSSPISDHVPDDRNASSGPSSGATATAEAVS